MHGIDVSNWQGCAEVSAPLDFIIAKASEGTSFEDRTLKHYADYAGMRGILFGFYHFATAGGNPEREAEFFHNCTWKYLHWGIPVLDYEVSNANDAQWCERFIKHYHDMTGIWCVLYVSASWCSKFAGSWIPSTCPLWMAGYPYPAKTWTDDRMPYDVSPWAAPIIWQFTSSLRLDGYSGDLDGNIAYIDRKQWKQIANGGFDMETCEKILAYLEDESDPSGRNVKANLKTRVAFIAKKQEAMQKDIDAISRKLDKILEAIEK